jgi:hypothetical protein
MTQTVKTVYTAENRTGPAIRGVVGGMRGVQRSQEAVAATSKSFNKGLSENRRGIQQFGFQIGDVAVQMAGGQDAMLAFTQQGSQMLQFFGPAGSILGAFLAVFGAVFIAMGRAGVGLGQLSPALGLLQADLVMLREAMAGIADMFVSVGNLIVNNLMMIVAAVAIVAGTVLGNYVRSMIAASLATGRLAVVMNTVRAMVLSTAIAYGTGGVAAAAMTVATNVLTGALTLLRAAFLTLLPVAVLMAFAWAIQAFMALRRGAGGTGEAFALMGDVAKGVMQGIRNTAQAAAMLLSAAFKTAIAAVIGYFSLLAKAWDGVANGIITVNNALASTTIGSKMGMAAMELSDVSGSLRKSAGDVLGSAAEDVKKAGELWNATTGTADALKRLKEAYNAGSVDIDLRNLTGGGAPGEDGGGKSIADKMSEQAAEIKKTFEDLSKGISDSMLSGFKAVLAGTQTMGDAMRNILSDIANRIIDILMTPVFNKLAGNIAGGILGTIDGGIASFAGGGYTGSGARVGGMDGKGGKLALLHPNETVVDHTLGGRSMTTGSQGAAPITVTITVNAQGAQQGVAEQIAAELDRRVPALMKQAVAATQSARMRGYTNA